MFMRLLTVFAVLALCPVSFSQTAPASQDSMPALQHFSPDQADKSLTPCSDFFQYACTKWIKANPIPADQSRSGTFAKLNVWNNAAVRNTLESAAGASNRTPIEQKIGDYYASCVDEATTDKLGIDPLLPMLDHIAKLPSKSQLPELVARIHQVIRPADLNRIDAEYQGVLFGLYAWPDFDNARMTLAAIDQSGMGLPGREFYLNDDDKSKQIRDQYVKHVANMLELSG